MAENRDEARHVGLQDALGESSSFLDFQERLSRAATVDRALLLIGERGTGKELAVSKIHYLSARWQSPLIALNCAALAPTLVESELFGHEAGAFTGATRRRSGRFEAANQGTLFLDEIAVIPRPVQEKILRVIEYGEFERVGGSETLHVDTRVVGVTNVDLPALAADGTFRPDLLDRLAFDVVTVPPLRARPVDIPVLARAFALDMTRELGRPLFPGFTRAAEEALLAHPWPGNVRELKNVVERTVYRAPPGEEPIARIAFDPFASPWRPGGTPGGAPGAGTEAQVLPENFTAAVSAYARGILERALAECRHNRTDAAGRLGLGYHQFRRLLKKHGVD